METVSVLYAIPNYECNLSCRYCQLKDKRVDYNKKKFLDVINNFNGDIVLFGGEPTLYIDRFKEILETGKITSITSNLMNINRDIVYLSKHCRIATTLRPCKKWKENLKLISDNNDYGIRILITLTDEIIDTQPEKLIEYLSKLVSYGCNIDSILFEQLLDKDKDQDFYCKVDNWLYDIHIKYRLEDIGVCSIIIDQILDGWNFNCSTVKTLEPDGTIKAGCPQRETYNILPECFNCSLSNTCNPCILQTQCVYPKKFGKEVLLRYDKKKRIQQL